MSTLLIFSNFETLPLYAVVPGDYSRFNNILINAVPENDEEEKLQQELTAFLYDDEGNNKIEFQSTFQLTFSGAADIKVASIGFYP